MRRRRKLKWSETNRVGEKVRWERLELGAAGRGAGGLGGGYGDGEDGEDEGEMDLDLDLDDVDSDLDDCDDAYEGNSSDEEHRGGRSSNEQDPSGYRFGSGGAAAGRGRGGGRPVGGNRKEIPVTDRWEIDKEILEDRPVSIVTLRLFALKS